MPITVQYLSLDKLKPYQNALRSHSPKKIKKLCASIERFGMMAPILIDASGTIIDGHARLTAARKLRMAKVPVISTDGLSEAEVRALRLAMNRLQDEAYWDPKALQTEFLGFIELNFDLDLTGFDATEIDLSLDFVADAPGDVEEIEDETLRQIVVVPEPGDIWVLGHHRIGCGDCLNLDFARALIAGRKAQVCFTDPPYNVPVRGHISSLAKHEEFAMASGEMNLLQFSDFLKTSCSMIGETIAPGAVAFVCMDWRSISSLVASAAASGFELLNMAVWVKTSPGMGSLYRSQHELVAVLKRPGASHRNNVELGKNGRSRSNVWTYRGVNVMGPERHLLYEHPTVKPAALIADALRDVSRAGDIVFDPFLGSGSTLIAAERTGRHCIGIEIAPKYVDVAIRRWQAETGKDAIRERDGKSFNDLAAQAQAVEPASQEAVI